MIRPHGIVLNGACVRDTFIGPVRSYFAIIQAFVDANRDMSTMNAMG